MKSLSVLLFFIYFLAPIAMAEEGGSFASSSETQSNCADFNGTFRNDGDGSFVPPFQLKIVQNGCLQADFIISIPGLPGSETQTLIFDGVKRVVRNDDSEVAYEAVTISHDKILINGERHNKVAGKTYPYIAEYYFTGRDLVLEETDFSEDRTTSHKSKMVFMRVDINNL